MSKDEFQFITVVKRGDRLTLFVDGRKDADLATFPELPRNNLPFTLSAADQSLSGVMSDVRLYGGAISPGDVVTLYAEAASYRGTARRGLQHPADRCEPIRRRLAALPCKQQD